MKKHASGNSLTLGDDTSDEDSELRDKPVKKRLVSTQLSSFTLKHSEEVAEKLISGDSIGGGDVQDHIYSADDLLEERMSFLEKRISELEKQDPEEPEKRGPDIVNHTRTVSRVRFSTRSDDVDSTSDSSSLSTVGFSEPLEFVTIASTSANTATPRKVVPDPLNFLDVDFGGESSKDPVVSIDLDDVEVSESTVSEDEAGEVVENQEREPSSWEDCLECSQLDHVIECLEDSRTSFQAFLNSDLSDEIAVVSVIGLIHISIVLALFFAWNGHHAARHVKNLECTDFPDVMLAYFIASLILFVLLPIYLCYQSRLLKLALWLCCIEILLDMIILFVDFFLLDAECKMGVAAVENGLLWTTYKVFIYWHILIACFGITGLGCVVGYFQDTVIWRMCSQTLDLQDAIKALEKNKKLVVYSCFCLILLVHTIMGIVMFVSLLQDGGLNVTDDCTKCKTLLQTYFWQFFASPVMACLCTPMMGQTDFRHKFFLNAFEISTILVFLFIFIDAISITSSCETIIKAEASSAFLHTYFRFSGWVFVEFLFCSILYVTNGCIFRSFHIFADRHELQGLTDTDND